LHGGALQYVNAYGLPAFVDRARALASSYGPRFEPPALLVRKAEAGETFG
jgi:3-hydroxyacyl-CoA dehydrogenase/enoyl-CoA hydratase/3-hydroxybutyryl-CoA epimerase